MELELKQRYVIDFDDLEEAYKEEYGEDLDIDDISAFRALGGHCFYTDFWIQEEKYQYEIADNDEDREWYRKSYNVAVLLLKMNELQDDDAHVLILYDW